MTDHQLLDQFITDRCEQSFRELVQRYTPLVYHCALRRTGSRETAEEISQNVFRALALKAPSLKARESLAMWLHRAAVLESASTYRSEVRRQRRLNQLAAETSLTMNSPGPHPTSDEHWIESLPHLDEAIHDLRPSDRRLILLRFFERKSFKEIGLTIGKSEEASRKALTRATEKLGSQLRRRGAAIPSALLGAGLATQFSQEAPAGLADTLSSTVLRGLNESALAVGESSLAPVTAVKSSSLVVPAIVLWLTSVVGGYWIGHQSSPAATATPTPRDLPALSGPARQRSADAPAARLASNTATASEMDETTLRKILELAKEDFALGIWDSDAYWRATLRLRQIPSRSLRRALGLIEQMPGGVQQEAALAVTLLRRLAERDGAGSVAYAQEHFAFQPRVNAIGTALQGWAKTNPADAFAWYLENRAASPALSETLSHILPQWVERDPYAALEAYEQLRDPHDRFQGFRGLLGAVTDPEFRLDLIQLIVAAPAGQERGEFAGYFVGRWAHHDPLAAAKWLESARLGKVETLRATQNLLHTWMDTDAPAAANWVVSNADPEDQAKAYETVVDAWRFRDAVALGEWLATKPRNETTDPAVAKYARQLVLSDPERALSWAAAITSASLRRESLQLAAGMWHQRAPQHARDGIQALDLPAAEREALLESLPASP